MIRVFYPALFAEYPVLSEQAEALAAHIYELSEFLVKVLAWRMLGQCSMAKWYTTLPVICCEN
jgi:hypothetical protein